MAPFLLGAMSNERTDVGVCGAAGGGGGNGGGRARTRAGNNGVCVLCDDSMWFRVVVKVRF